MTELFGAAERKGGVLDAADQPVLGSTPEVRLQSVAARAVSDSEL
jgi:hypothetical protein